MERKFKIIILSTVISSLLIGSLYYQSISLDENIIIEAHLTKSTYDVKLNEIVLFNATGSIGTELNYYWVLPFDNTTSTEHTPILIHKFTTPGHYQISLIVIDNHGLADLTTANVVINYEPPNVNMEVPSEGMENENIEFSAFLRSGQPGIKYLWNFGDGTNSTFENPTHQYNDSGMYWVSLLAQDDLGGVDYKYQQITIKNQIPVAIAELDKTNVVEDEMILFNASKTIDSLYDLSHMTYLWEFGDGKISDQKVVSHSYSNQGIYNVSLKVQDDNSQESQVNVEITVDNVIPTIQIDEMARYVEGQTYIFKASMTDTETDYSYLNPTWNLNQTGDAITFSPQNSGQYEISSTVQDNNGGYAEDRIFVDVENVAPYAFIQDVTVTANITLFVIGNIRANLTIDLLQDHNSVHTFNPTDLNEILRKDTLANMQMPISNNWNIGINYTSVADEWFKFAFILVIINNDPGLIVKSHLILDLYEDTHNATLSINDSLVGFPIQVKSSIFDAGDDDLNLKWTSENNPNNSLVKEYSATPGSPNEINDISNVILLPQGLGDLAEFLNSFFNGSWVDNALDTLGLLSTILIQNCFWDVFQDITSIAQRILDRWDLDNVFFVSLDNSIYTNLKLSITDSDGAVTNLVSTFLVDDNGISVANISPQIKMKGSNQAVTEDEILNFSLEFDDVSPNTQVTWILGDGKEINAQAGDTIYYSYPNKGIYQVTVILNDGNLFDYKIIEVKNTSPKIRLSYPQTVFEDEIINFDATQVIDTKTDLELLKFYWDFGDGTLGNGSLITHTYVRTGNYSVSLWVTDNNGVQSTVSKQIEVLNQIPVISTPSSIDGFEGELISLVANTQDTSSDNFDLKYSWELNGAVFSNEKSINSYFDDGDHSFKLTVSDDDNMTSEKMINIKVINIKPQGNLINTGFLGQIDWFVNLTAFVWDSPIDMLDLSYDWYLTTFGSANQHLTPIKVTNSMLQTTFQVSTITRENYDNIIIIEDDIDENIAQGYFSSVTDTDGDLIIDFEEIVISHTSPVKYDTDDDKLLDILEPILGTNPLLADTDNDGLWDGYNPEVGFGEMTLGTSPSDNDTDDDGLIDGIEVFGWEITVVSKDGISTETVYSDPVLADTDRDGVSDGEEYRSGSNPWAQDTDQDGLTDLQEFQMGTNLANYDTDGDNVTDGLELEAYNVVWQTSNLVGYDTHSIYITSDPKMADTDGDGLSDFEERFAGNDNAVTNAANPDTDNDEVNDGKEYYTVRKTISERLNYRFLSLNLPSFSTYLLGNVIKAELYFSTSGTTKDDISIQIFKLNNNNPFDSQDHTYQPDLGSGPVSAVSIDITNDYSQFTGRQGWVILISHPSINFNFIVEELTFVFTIAMSQLNNDMDGDLISDGEEITPGADGWVTDPNKLDTDGDGLSDLSEIVPFYGSSEKTNPTIYDTDGDGINDKFDVNPLANTLLSIELISITALKDLDGESGWGNLFGIIYMESEIDDTYFYVTETKNFDREETINYHDKYYFELNDDVTSIDYRIEMWDRDSISDDDFLGSGSSSYYLSSGEHQSTFVLGDYMSFEFRIETVLRPHIPVYIINASSMIINDFNDLNYVGDEQFYIFYVQVRIEIIPEILSLPKELITILVSRGTIINTRLNSTFLQGSLQDVPEYLQDFDFSTDDYTGGATRKLIAGVLSGSLLEDELDLLLDLLSTNSTGNKFGEAIQVNDELYQLGISPEIINMVPLEGFVNSNTGEMPKTFLDRVGEAVSAVINVAVDVVNFVASGIVAIGDFLVSIVEIVASIGKKVLGAIKEVFDQVVEIVQKLVDIIQITIKFMTDIIVSTFNLFVDQIISIANDWLDLYIAKMIGFVKSFSPQSSESLSLNQDSTALSTLLDILYLVTFGSLIFFVAAAIATAIAIADAITVVQTSGLASVIKAITSVPIKNMGKAIIIELLALTILEAFTVEDENPEENFLSQINNFIHAGVLYFSIFGVTIADIFLAGGAYYATKTRALASIDDGGAWAELVIGIVTFFLLVARIFFLGPKIEEESDQFMKGVLIFSQIGLDILVTSLAFLAKKKGLEIVGRGRNPLDRFYAIVVPLVDYLPYFIISVSVVGLVEDAILVADFFLGGS